MERELKIMKASQGIIHAVDGMNMGDFITTICITIDMLCTHFGIDVREVAKDMYDEIVSVCDFADAIMKGTSKEV